MTAARARGVAIAGALAVAWVVATLLLSRTSVPDDLALPKVDVGAVFGAELVARAERYRRFLYVDWVLAEAALLVTLAVYAKRGARLARESAAGPIGTGMLLGMTGLGLAWVVRLPFSVAALWWQRRHGLSSHGYVDVLVNGWLGLAGTFVALSLALLVLMALARRLGSWWWLPGSLVLASVAAGWESRRRFRSPCSSSRFSSSPRHRRRTSSADGWRRRPTGRHCRRRTTPPRRAASSGSSRRPRSEIRARRGGRNHSSGHTRLSPTASRWPTPGRPDAGRSCQARCHVLFGRGVLRQVHGMPSTVSCICRASERLRAGLRRARHEATSEPDASVPATAR